MTMTHKLPLVIMVLVALASGFAMHAAAGTPNQVGVSGQLAAAGLLPFKGTLEGRHVSRTPLDPPFVFDRFETEGQATQLGRFELVVEAAVDRRPGDGQRQRIGRELLGVTAEHVARILVEQDHCGERGQRVIEEAFGGKLALGRP